MKTVPSQLIQTITQQAWDAELIWLAVLQDEMFVALEPAGEADEAVARCLSLRLANHAEYPELPWTEIVRNLTEEN